MAITPWLFALTLALAAIPTFTMHSFLRLAVRANGSVQQEAKDAARRAWWVVALFTAAAATVGSVAVPRMMHNFATYAWGDLFPILALAGLIGVRLWDRKETESLTYFASTVYIAGMLSSAAFAALF